jgi:CelD/BcsL family acetyltransferase involved in cellulose biosynthesis
MYGDYFSTVKTTSVPVDVAQLVVSFVKREDEFYGMGETWKDIVDHSECTIFQTFEWQRTWWEYFGRNKDLYCAVCREGQEIVGLLPMFVEYTSLLGLKLIRCLRFIGTGLSDYLEPIVLPGYEELVIGAFVNSLQEHKQDWDILEISDVSETRPLPKMLIERMKASGARIYSYKGDLSSQVMLPSTWEEFLKQLGKHGRHELKRKTEKMKEGAALHVEVLGNEPSEVRGAVEGFALIHGNRWRSLGYKSAFDDDKHLDFHRKFAEEFSKRGWLQIFFLTLNGERVAVNFGFHFNKRIYVYQANAFARDEIMKCSPGFVLHCEVIKRGIEKGMTIYDMLRGSQEYKSRDFKSIQTGNWLIRAYFPSRVNSLRFKIYVLIDFFRKILRRMGREYHEFKRFVNTQNPTLPSIMGFFFARVKLASTTGFSYFRNFVSKSRSTEQSQW